MTSSDYRAPQAEEHTAACRALLFAWRLRNTGLPAVNDVTRFPCACAETGGEKKPWRLVETAHPAWCVVEGLHPWTSCTITQMTTKEQP